MAKRTFDLFFSFFGLILLSPIFLVVAFLIKLDSPGPVFFRQTRIGRNLDPFRIHKFRTMVVNSACLGPSITTEGDKRVTRVGKFLREYKLDEIPQLIDVLFGKMSFVGPRPEIPKYVDAYSEEDKKIIFLIKPGITDRASIRFRAEGELIAEGSDADKVYIEQILPIKLAYYREYVETRSFWLDLKIILKTIWSVTFLNLIQ